MIICCGEALIDMVEGKNDDGTRAFVPHAGGALLNSAVALGRLGIQAAYFGRLSNDIFGQQLQDHFAQSNVDLSLCPVVDAPTTLAFVILNDGQASYAFYDENTALRGLTRQDIAPLPDQTKALFFGGISLANGACADTYEHLLAKSAPDYVTMIDPNIRPAFVDDETAYRARLNRMIAQSDIVKLSDEDLMWVAGEGDVDTLAQQLLQRGPKVVLITLGSKGAKGYWKGGDAFAPTTPIDLSNSDTIGAGDTFNAGVLAAWDQLGCLSKDAIESITQDQVQAALELGTRAARVTISRKGANPPWANELPQS